MLFIDRGAQMSKRDWLIVIGLLLVLILTTVAVHLAKAQQREDGVTLEMPLICIKKVTFFNCHPDNGGMLHCKKVIVDHVKGCEIVVANPVTNGEK